MLSITKPQIADIIILSNRPPFPIKRTTLTDVVTCSFFKIQRNIFDVIFSVLGAANMRRTRPVVFGKVISTSYSEFHSGLLVFQTRLTLDKFANTNKFYLPLFKFTRLSRTLFSRPGSTNLKMREHKAQL